MRLLAYSISGSSGIKRFPEGSPCDSGTVIGLNLLTRPYVGALYVKKNLALSTKDGLSGLVRERGIRMKYKFYLHDYEIEQTTLKVSTISRCKVTRKKIQECTHDNGTNELYREGDSWWKLCVLPLEEIGV